MEKNELFSLIFTELWDRLNYRHYCSRPIEIEVEISDRVIFCMTAYICANHCKDDYEITEANIAEAYFQYPDFETDLRKEYIEELEKFILS